MTNEIKTFRVARRLGSKSRPSLHGLNGLPEIADRYGVGLTSHPGMAAVDLIFGRETADLQERFRRITKGHTSDTVDALKNSRRTTLDRFMDLSLDGSIDVYEIGGGEKVIGVGFEKIDQELLIEERKLAGICLASVARVKAPELELDNAQQFLTIGLIYNDPSEEALDGLVAHLEQKFPLPDEVGFFDVTVRDATITRR
jgi:hypothetical protein